MGFDTRNLKPWVISAGNELQRMFGLNTIGGWRKEDEFPDHPGGYALDLMTNDIGGPKLRNPKGDAIASYLIANSARLGVKYIIWNGQSWNPQRGTWAPYKGSNPHTDHVHVTFTEQGGTGGPILQVGDTSATPTGFTKMSFDVDGFMKKAEGTTITAMGGFFGVALIAVGVILAVRGTAGKSIEKKLGAQ